MELVRQEIEKELAKIGIVDAKIEKPPENIDADLCIPCFSFAKQLKKSPQKIAEELAAKLCPKYVKDVKSLGPYINFHIDWGKYGQKVLQDILKKKNKYGSFSVKENIVMDVYQANPFKSFHIGHVRNACIGESVRRILEFTGRKTTAITYNGDVGVHVARWLWYYKNFYKGKVPKTGFTKWAGEIYAKASEKIKEKDEYKEQVDEINRKLDKGDTTLTKLWKEFRQLCYDDFGKIAKELDVKVNRNIPESECVDPGKKLVEKLFEEKKLIKSNGAIGLDLEKYGLGFFMLLKSDGTSLYSTKDYGLFYLKSKIGSFDRYIYVVGSEQEYYFKQLFKSYEVLDIHNHEKHYHLSHNLVTLKEGKMASRLGNVILYEDLRDETMKKVLEQMEEKSDVKNKEEVAKQIAFGAIKFSMLGIENNRLIKFDWNEALDINGRSGPYLQYSYARAISILRKSVIGDKKFSASDLKEEKEKSLMKKLSEFPDSVDNAANEMQPYTIANYVFELATKFNEFYQTIPVLKSEGRVSTSRLALVEATSIVLKTGMSLLGIATPEKM